jgi:energy-converting hydrogenase Eha subunit C
LFVAADLLYEAVRGLVVGDPGAAMAHAAFVVQVERSIGLFHEAHLQALVLGHTGVVRAANWLYLNVQFTANAAFLAFLFLCRPTAYLRARNAMFVAMGLALVVHLLFPVAPPRMLGSDGFVDTVKTMGGLDQDSGAVGFMVNPYAAVPSMHVCFAIIVGLTGAALATRALSVLAWVSYPVLVSGLVVVTANHFFLDIAAGAVTAGLAWAVAGTRIVPVPGAGVPAAATPTGPPGQGGRGL